MTSKKSSTPSSARLGHRGPRVVLELRTIQLVEGPQRRGVEEPLHDEHLVGQERELSRQERPDLLAGRRVDLEPNRGGASKPAPKDGLDRLEEIPALLLLQLEVRVSGQAEDRMTDDLHAREQDLEVGRDDLLDGDEPLAVRASRRTAGAAAAPSRVRSGALRWRGRERARRG